MRIRIFIVALLFIAIMQLPAQSWLQRADLPFNIHNSEGTSFAIGDKVYLVCGVVNNNYSNFCWEFNTTTNIWTQKTSFPGCPRRWPSSFSIGGKGYFLGGEDTISGTNNDLWEYDPIADFWIQKTSLPSSIRCGAISWVINGKGYVVSGAQSFGIILNDCWQYDPILDSWMQKTSMPCTGRVFGTGFSIGNNGYAGLGTDYSTYLRDWWEYDAINDNWAIKDSLNSDFVEGSSFSIGAYGYVGPLGLISTWPWSFFRFDPSNGSWSQLIDFTGAAYSNCYSASCQGKGYIISGNSFSLCEKQTWEFTAPVGIQEYAENSFTAFPNPSNDFVNIELNQNLILQGSIFTIELCDVPGKIVRKENKTTVNNSVTIEKGNLMSGIYFFTIMDDEKVLGHGKIVFK